MNYLNKIGIKSKKAFNKLVKIKSTKINSVLEDYNKLLLKKKI